MMVHAILTCHNRRTLTRRCLRSLEAACSIAGVSYSVTLVDDGSTDGTSDLVGEEFPDVNILRGDGTLFWAAGMALAEQAALAMPHELNDYLLWLNDDVELDGRALETLLNCAIEMDAGVVVGAVRNSPDGSDVSYSGQRRTMSRRFNFVKVVPDGSPQLVDTFNGNVVLIRLDVQAEIGEIDGDFAHALADIDYGLRAAALGRTPVLASESVGWCAANESVESIGLRSAWGRFVSIRSPFHPRSYALFLRKHGGRLWWMRFIFVYLRFAAISVKGKRGGRGCI